MDDPDASVDGAAGAHAAGLRALAHVIGSYYRDLQDAGLPEVRAWSLARQYHSQLLQWMAEDGYQPDLAVGAWPPPGLKAPHPN